MSFGRNAILPDSSRAGKRRDSLCASLLRYPAPMQDSVAIELERLLDELMRLCSAQGLPRQPSDPESVSPCQVGSADIGGNVAWRPLRRDRAPDWSGLERALEAPLHPDIATFYGSYWSGPIPVDAEEGTATLIQIWNEADFDFLIENQLGHALQKSKRREPLTLFVACPDEGDLMLSVDNSSGVVVLEAPGRPPLRQVAANLVELLARMKPVAPDVE